MTTPTPPSGKSRQERLDSVLHFLILHGDIRASDSGSTQLERAQNFQLRLEELRRDLLQGIDAHLNDIAALVMELDDELNNGPASLANYPVQPGSYPVPPPHPHPAPHTPKPPPSTTQPAPQPPPTGGRLQRIIDRLGQ